MNLPFRLLPASAAASASRLDSLALCLLLVTGAVALALLALTIVFCVRSRAGAQSDRSHVPRTGRRLEIAWITWRCACCW